MKGKHLPDSNSPNHVELLQNQNTFQQGVKQVLEYLFPLADAGAIMYWQLVRKPDVSWEMEFEYFFALSR